MVGKTERPCLRQLEFLDRGVRHARGPVLVKIGQHHHGSSVAVREVVHDVADHYGRRETVAESRGTLPGVQRDVLLEHINLSLIHI